MNWYKKATINDLTQVVKGWLVRSYYGPVDEMHIQQDLNIIMPTADDSFAMSAAIDNGIQMAMSETGQDRLNEHQNAVVMCIQARMSQMMQAQPRMEMGPMNPNTEGEIYEQGQQEQQG